VLGLDGLVTGDCVGVVGAGPEGAAPELPAPEVAPEEEPDCAWACPIRSQSPNATAQLPSNSSARTVRSNVLLGIAISFASMFYVTNDLSIAWPRGRSRISPKR